MRYGTAEADEASVVMAANPLLSSEIEEIIRPMNQSDTH